MKALTDAPPTTLRAPPCWIVVPFAVEPRVEVPKAEALETSKTPASTVVAPSYVFVPDNFNLPEPLLVRDELQVEPLIAPVNSVEASEAAILTVRVLPPRSTSPAPFNPPIVSLAAT